MGGRETVGQRIKQARSKANISQDKLAKRLGVATMTVSRWETGSMSPEQDKLDAVATELGVTARWLHYGDDPARDDEPATDVDEVHPEVLVYLDAHPETHPEDASRLRAHFKRTALSEDVVRDIPGLLERAQLSRLRGLADATKPIGNRRTMAERDEEVRARRPK